MTTFTASNMKLVYILLDGIGDLPNPSLNGLTPLDAASTPQMDALAKNGCMGQVVSVGKGIAPQSDIAVFNMLGYSFKEREYVGRGVIEAIGCNIDFRDGDLALRGNFATVNKKNLQIIDRRAGRIINKDESLSICKTLQDNIKFSYTEVTVVVKPTIAHRVSIRFRHSKIRLSEKITNTDPAYDKFGGIGIAKSTEANNMRLERSKAEENTKSARIAAKIVNEFTEQVIELLENHPVNKSRVREGRNPINAILARDAGNRYPKVEPISKKYDLKMASIVDMPVELGISKVLGMKAFEIGKFDDYEEKAKLAVEKLKTFNAVYVHIKGPDEFGHDGDAKGKKESIEHIDKRFFGMLMEHVKVYESIIIISGDHSTPCLKKAHSDDPIPILVSGNKIKKDGSRRFTELDGLKGSMGVLMGQEVLKTVLNMITN